MVRTFTINEVLLQGNATADPEMTVTRKNEAIANFRLAQDGMGRKDREEACGFIQVTAFGGVAEYIGNTVTKGTALLVRGRLEHWRFDNPDGEGERGRHRIKASSITLIAYPNGRDHTKVASEEPANNAGSGAALGEQAPQADEAELNRALAELEAREEEAPSEARRYE